MRSLITTLINPIAHAKALDGPTAAITAFSERLPFPRPPAYVHPSLVLVPLTAWGSAKIFDLVGDRPAAQAVIGAGVLAAIPWSGTLLLAVAVLLGLDADRRGRGEPFLP